MTNSVAVDTSNSNTSLAKAWLVCMIGALYFFYIFIQMTKFNAIGAPLMSDFKIGGAGLGTLSSMYFIGNVVFLFPAGLLLDRFSTKKILLTVMSLTVLCTFAFAYTNTVAEASWLFFFTGIAGAFGLTAPLRLASRWFPSEKMALVSGLIVTIGFFGAMMSQSPLTLLVNAVGWREAMLWNAGLGVLILAIFAIFIKDFPEGSTIEISSEKATSLKFLLQSIKKAISNRQNWVFGLYTCLINMPVFVFGAVFGAYYLQEVHHLTGAQAAFANVLLFLGGMLGSPAYGWLSDKLGLRKLPMYLGGIITIALVLVIMYFQLNYVAAYILFFALGFITSSQVISYPVIAESSDPDNIATGFGMGSTLIMAGGAFLIPLFGWLLSMGWNGQMLNSVPFYSPHHFMIALWTLPIQALIAVLILKFGKETFCKRIV